MAKHDLVPIIDSSGKFSRRERAWLAKHKDDGGWIFGVFRFHPKPQRGQGKRAVGIADRLAQHPETPAPRGFTGGATDGFLPYPYASRGGSGRHLRERYPALARAGAGGL